MNKMTRILAPVLALLALTLGGIGTASAAPISCSAAPVDINYMEVDSAEVVACLASGLGNLSGNSGGGNPDPFLTGVGSAYSLVSKSDDASPAFNLGFTQNGSTGTWSFDASFWAMYSDAAIGFKFGTGDQPDEWFVFSVVGGVFSGNWEFFNHFGTGGGLSHVNLYGIRKAMVPEPMTFALLGAGLIGLGLRRRKII